VSGDTIAESESVWETDEYEDDDDEEEEEVAAELQPEDDPSEEERSVTPEPQTATPPPSNRKPKAAVPDNEALRLLVKADKHLSSWEKPIALPLGEGLPAGNYLLDAVHFNHVKGGAWSPLFRLTDPDKAFLLQGGRPLPPPDVYYQVA